MNYEEAIDFIHSTYKFGSKLGLENIRKLTELMGNPQDSYKIIHVAGTNGKGSTCSLIREVLIEAGYKTGFFISPYLEEFNERVQVNKEPIDKESLARITALVRDKINIMLAEGFNHPTEFEVITAIGFEYFKEQNIDFLVLEVGLGGRFDSTNIIKSPLVSVITSISYDHTDYLGDTLEKIAFEKAGIIKENSNVVIYPQGDNVKDVIKSKAAENNTLVYEANASHIEKINSNINGQEFKYLKNDAFQIDELKINLLGDHQLLNALTALLTLEVIKKEGFHISSENVVKGFLKCKFPGRFEILNKNPLIILDGGHNEDGIEKFAKTIKEYFNDKRIIFFFAMVKDKDQAGVIKHIVPISKEIYTLTPESPRALSAKDLSEMVTKQSNIKVTPLESYQDILTIIKNADKSDIIAFAGSLYMIGSVRTLLKNNAFTNNL